MLRYLALVGLALAKLPVYVLNAEAVAPANLVIENENAPQVLASHFIGAGVEEASLEALAMAQLIPSVLLDDRNAAVVVVGDFKTELAAKVFGSPLLSIDSSGPELSTVPRQLTASEISTIDNENWPVVVCGGDSESLKAIAQLKSKVLVIGVPAGEPLPDLQYTRIFRRRVARSASPSTIPALFGSQEQCEEITNNCSGRGECVKTPNGFKCACKATEKDGYTYNWGGNDCSKRDVSWQFNLLLWTTVGIVFAAVFGIKAMVSVGKTPLPGVLNAM